MDKPTFNYKKLINSLNLVFLCFCAFIIKTVLYTLVSKRISLSVVLILIFLITLWCIYRKTKNDAFLLLILVSILAAWLYFPFLSNEKLFCFNNDYYTQYEYFYKEWSRLINSFFKTGNMPFYSFNTFLGNNFYAFKLYYITGDLLYPISRLFNTINEGVAFESYVYVVLSALFIRLYLKKFGIKKETIIWAATILYSLGGLGTEYISTYVWQRFYCIFPLIFYGVECYRENNKLAVFSLSIFIGFMLNYYMMFPTTIFIAIYFIFTSYYHNDEVRISNILKRLVKLIVGYIIGFGVSGIIMIPNIYAMLENERVGSGLTWNLLYDLRVYVGYIYTMITRNIYENNYFTMNDNGHLSMYTNYVNSLVVPVAFSYYFVRRNDKKNYKVKALLIILTVITVIPLLSSIMHGFSGASMRWLYIPCFVYLLAFAIFFDNDNVDVLRFGKGLLLFTFIFILATVLAIVNGIMPKDLNNTTFISAVIPLMLNYIYLLALSKTSRGGLSYLLVVYYV